MFKRLSSAAETDLLADWILTTIETGANHESARVGGVADQVDDRPVRAQRPAPPVDRNERENPVFHLVPVASSWCEVAHLDDEIELVSNALSWCFQARDRLLLLPPASGWRRYRKRRTA